VTDLQLSLFDYNTLDAETRIVVQQRTGEIKALMRTTAQGIIDIGAKLIEVKQKLEHGQFGGWLKIEFDWTPRTAQRFIGVTEHFKNDNLSHLNIAPSALYLLAAPSTPDEVRDHFIEQSQNGASVGYTEVKELKQAFDIAPDPIKKRLLDGEISPRAAIELTKAIQEVPEETRAFILENEITDPKTIPYVHEALQRNGDTAQTMRVSKTLDGEVPLKEATERDFKRYLEQAHFEYKMAGVARKVGTPPALQSSESNEWYTPAEYIEAARVVMGTVDLDPASCEFANQTVKATRIYTIEENGLKQVWRGNVWLNPPYGRDGGESNQGRWSARLIEAYEAGSVSQAVMLVNAVTDREWFYPLWNYPICFVYKRIRFYNQVITESDPTHGNVLVYFGKNVKGFSEQFGKFGRIVVPSGAYSIALPEAA
jgi:hypothetical protein